MAGGIPGILEGALDTVHDAVSTLIGTNEPQIVQTPYGDKRVLTVAQLQATGLTVNQATALGYLIVPG